MTGAGSRGSVSAAALVLVAASALLLGIVVDTTGETGIGVSRECRRTALRSAIDTAITQLARSGFAPFVTDSGGVRVSVEAAGAPLSRGWSPIELLDAAGMDGRVSWEHCRDIAYFSIYFDDLEILARIGATFAQDSELTLLSLLQKSREAAWNAMTTVEVNLAAEALYRGYPPFRRFVSFGPTVFAGTAEPALVVALARAAGASPDDADLVADGIARNAGYPTGGPGIAASFSTTLSRLPGDVATRLGRMLRGTPLFYRIDACDERMCLSRIVARRADGRDGWFEISETATSKRSP